MAKTLRPHPIAELFPRFQPEEQEALVADIQQHGVRIPVIVKDGLILDGRHRYEICQQLGIDCPITEDTGADAWWTAVSANLLRRHLRPDQIVAIYLLAANRLPELAMPIRQTKQDAHERQRARLKRGPAMPRRDHVTPTGGRSADILGKMLTVSGPTVNRVQKVDRLAPRLLPAVAAGQLSAVEALRQVAAEKVRAERDARIAAMPQPTGDHGIVIGRFQQVDAEWLDNTVDLIFTDPPYHDKHLPLYRDLGVLAARILRPGGSLLTYAGHGLMPRIAAHIEESGLKYWWIHSVRHPGSGAQMDAKGIKVGWKPILQFIKSPTTDRDRQRFVLDFVESKREKDFHEWQQGEGVAEHFINGLTDPGDLVLDPMCGSGTTLVVAQRLGRRWLGCDVDEAAVRISRARMMSAAV